MKKLQLTMAGLPTDRIYPLASGEVQIEGAELKYLPIRHPVEIFSRMLRSNEFDVAEMSVTHCFVLKAENRARFVTLPVFPSRMFRHGFIFVNTRSGIGAPKDLENRRIGVQGHQSTAAIWIRGILQHEYGVSFKRVRWFEGGVNRRGVPGGEVTALRPAEPLAVEFIGESRTLNDMLAAGEIDALIGPEAPNALRTSKDVARLWPDYHRLETEYHRRTGIFPIMHALVMREELYREHPWLAARVYKAFVAAKDLAQLQSRFTGAMSYMLPWMFEQLEEIDAVFGADFWPYGLEPNRRTLEAYAQMLLEQKFLSAPVRLEDIFLPVQESTKP